MAFIVEDGTGLSTATSLCSVAAADAYLAAHFNASAWTGDDATVKEPALQRATRFLYQKYAGKWKGFLVRDTQALPWPRYSAYDEEQNAIDFDIVPDRVKWCVAELALLALSEDLNPNFDNPSAIKRERSKLDVLEEDIEYFGPKQLQKKYSAALDLIAPLLRNTNHVERM